MTLHVTLADEIISRFGGHLDGAPEFGHDAVTFRFQNGLVLQARFASPEEYSLHWQFEEGEWRIDTAPLHPGLASFPRHLHRPDGTVRADPFTHPGRSPQENLAAVLSALLADPRLASLSD